MCKSLIKITNMNESNKKLAYHDSRNFVVIWCNFSDLIKNQRDKTLLFECPFTVRQTDTQNYN